MMDNLTKQTALEFRAERVDGLFRIYVEKLSQAQRTLVMSDWFETGKAWEAFALAANEAEVDPRGVPFKLREAVV